MPTCFRLVSLLICCRIWPETELSVRIFRHVRIWKSVIMIKCVCVQLTRNKATFKESVTVVHFEILAEGAKPNQIGCGGKTVKGVFCLCLDWSHYWGVLSDVLYNEYLSAVIGCVIYAKSCHINSVRRVTSLRRPYMRPPQWSVQLRRTSFLFVSSTMLLICTSYTVTFYIIQTNIFH